MLRYVLIFGILISHAAFGQTDSVTTRRWTPSYPPQEAPPSMWFTLGYGSSKINYLAVLVSFAGEVEKHHLLTSRFIVGFGDAAGKMPPETFYDMGVLYGYSNDNILWFINVSAGLSCVIYNQRILESQDISGPFPRDIFKIKSHVVPAIPLQLQIYSRFSETSGGGLGFNIGGSINKIRSNFFLTFSLIVGFY
jgi:hypothetical protein